MRKLSRKDRAICILIVVVVVGCVVVARYLPPAMAYWGSSEVYKRYSRVEGVRATYVKDFRVNDTLTVGVTLLEATDSAGWEYLLDRFNVPDDMRKMIDAYPQLGRAWSRMAPKGNPEELVGSMKQDDGEQIYEMVAISNDIRAISIFHTNDKEELLAVHDYGYDYMTNKTNQFTKI